jgi:hypothetical protein
MRNLTRRKFIKIGCAATAALGGNTMLFGCSLNEPPAVTADPTTAPEQFKKEAREYSIYQKDNLMKQFDDLSKEHKEYLVKRHDASKVNMWISRARKDYEVLIPQIPYVGGEENRFSDMLVLTSTFIPLLKILREEGMSTRENGRMIVETADALYQDISWIMKWLMTHAFFDDSRKRRRQVFAQRSQQCRFPDDWVLEYVEGDGKTFVVGSDYSECAIMKFYAQHNLEEFVPYLCLCDYAKWKVIGIEATRTQTLANGGSKCDFRFIKKGPNGASPWPPESHAGWTGKFET